MKLFRKSMSRALLAVAIVTVGTFSGALEVQAEEKGASLAQQIQGSWSLFSIYNELDGKKTDVFGPNPRGSLLLNPDGRFAYILMRESLPKFASTSRQKGTVEENQAVVQGSLAYFGTYSVGDDKEQTVNLHVEGSTFPNWDGQDQKRLMTVSDDELKMVNPTPSLGGGTNYIILKRAK